MGWYARMLVLVIAGHSSAATAQPYGREIVSELAMREHACPAARVFVQQRTEQAGTTGFWLTVCGQQRFYRFDDATGRYVDQTPADVWSTIRDTVMRTASREHACALERVSIEPDSPGAEGRSFWLNVCGERRSYRYDAASDAYLDQTDARHALDARAATDRAFARERAVAASEALDLTPPIFAVVASLLTATTGLALVLAQVGVDGGTYLPSLTLRNTEYVVAGALTLGLGLVALLASSVWLANLEQERHRLLDEARTLLERIQIDVGHESASIGWRQTF